MTDVQTPTVEEVLQRAGSVGLTVNEVMTQTGGSETTTRRKVKALIAAEKAVRRATLDGTKIIWAGQSWPEMTQAESQEPQGVPEPDPEPLPASPSAIASDGRQLSKRRIAAQERDAATFEVLEKAGAMGIELAELAKRIGADDIEPFRNGFSQLTYLALRRLRDQGRVEKVIRWRIVPSR